MYRRCVFCGWGRKECLEMIKFFCIPKEAGLQRLQWMQALADKRQNGFKKVDSVCSIHFDSGKPSSDSSHPDFVPHLFLDRKTIPEDVMKQVLRHYSNELPEVEEKRKQRLAQLGERMKKLKEQKNEPKDAWKQRKKEREQKRAEEAQLNQETSDEQEIIYVDDEPSFKRARVVRFGEPQTYRYSQNHSEHQNAYQEYIVEEVEEEEYTIDDVVNEELVEDTGVVEEEDDDDDDEEEEEVVVDDDEYVPLQPQPGPSRIHNPPRYNIARAPRATYQHHFPTRTNTKPVRTVTARYMPRL